MMDIVKGEFLGNCGYCGEACYWGDMHYCKKSSVEEQIAQSLRRIESLLAKIVNHYEK